MGGCLDRSRRPRRLNGGRSWSSPAPGTTSCSSPVARAARRRCLPSREGRRRWPVRRLELLGAAQIPQRPSWTPADMVPLPSVLGPLGKGLGVRVGGLPRRNGARGDGFPPEGSAPSASRQHCWALGPPDDPGPAPGHADRLLESRLVATSLDSRDRGKAQGDLPARGAVRCPSSSPTAPTRDLGVGRGRRTRPLLTSCARGIPALPISRSTSGQAGVPVVRQSHLVLRD